MAAELDTCRREVHEGALADVRVRVAAVRLLEPNGSTGLPPSRTAARQRSSGNGGVEANAVSTTAHALIYKQGV